MWTINHVLAYYLKALRAYNQVCSERETAVKKAESIKEDLRNALNFKRLLI